MNKIINKLNTNIFDFCVLCKYKVTRRYKGSFYCPTYEDDNRFEDYKGSTTKTISGCELYEWLLNDLKSEHFLGFRVNENQIHINHFNPSTGEPCDIYYKIICLEK